MIGDSKWVMINPFLLTIKCLSRSLIKCFKVKQIILEMEINNSWMKKPNPFLRWLISLKLFFVFVFYSLIDLPWRNWSCLIWTFEDWNGWKYEFSFKSSLHSFRKNKKRRKPTKKYLGFKFNGRSQAFHFNYNH